MSQPLLLAVAGGSVAAMLLLAAVGSPLLGAMVAYFTPLPLLCVGLGLGSGAASIASASGIVLVLLLGTPAAAAVFGGMHAIPSWMVVRHALSRRPAAQPGAPEAWASVGDVLATISGIAAAAIACIAIMAGGAVGLDAALRESVDLMLATAMPAQTAASRDAVISAILPMFLGLGGAIWMATMALNVGLAQAILVRFGRNIRPTPRWGDITLPDWSSWALVAVAVVALFAEGTPEFVAKNLVLIFAAPFLFVGLAVVHRLAGQTGFKGPLLFTFYVALVVLGTIVGPIVTALGIVDQWIGIRSRLSGGPADQENV